MNVTNINFNDIRLNSKEYLKQFMIKWDRNIWEDELEMKTSLQIYKQFKNDFGEEEIYDNRPSSTILYKARTNTLQLNNRNRHTIRKFIVQFVIQMIKKIYTTLCYIVLHTKNREVKVYTYNNHISKK